MSDSLKTIKQKLKKFSGLNNEAAKIYKKLQESQTTNDALRNRIDKILSSIPKGVKPRKSTKLPPDTSFSQKVKSGQLKPLTTVICNTLEVIGFPISRQDLLTSICAIGPDYTKERVSTAIKDAVRRGTLTKSNDLFSLAKWSVTQTTSVEAPKVITVSEITKSPSELSSVDFKLPSELDDKDEIGRLKMLQSPWKNS